MKVKNIPDIDHETWSYTDTCECGGPVFKYHNTSKNIYSISCGVPKETYDIKSKKWVPLF